MNLDLQTKRLSLRPLAVSDLDLALEMFTDEAVTRYIGNVSTEEQITQEIERNTKRGADGYIGVWCMRHRMTGEKLGKVNLLSPAKGKRFRAVGTVKKPGRHITVTEGELFASDDGEQKLVATMTGTIMSVYDRKGVEN